MLDAPTMYPSPPADLDTTGPLRTVLRANALFSVVSGALFLVGGTVVADVIGTDEVDLVRLLGIGLLAFGDLVWLASRLRSADRLRTAALATSVSDFGWVVGTAGVAALGWLSGRGNLVMGAVAVLVAVFGALQLRHRRRV